MHGYGGLRTHPGGIVRLSAPAASLNDRNLGAIDSKGRYHGLDMTAPFNLIGRCPALSIPSGATSAGLPSGLQIVGRRFSDLATLKLGARVESLIPPLQICANQHQ